MNQNWLYYITLSIVDYAAIFVAFILYGLLIFKKNVEIMQNPVSDLEYRTQRPLGIPVPLGKLANPWTAE